MNVDRPRHASGSVPLVRGALGRFQSEFAQALRARGAPEDATTDVAALVRQPGFAVYRNTVRKGCIDALQANFPAVARLVGEEWFRAAAAVFVDANLPTQPSLLHYGASFADFLAAFEPAREFSYLPGVARLDRFWSEAHAARDEPPLAPEALPRERAGELQELVLRPHASTRWMWFEDQPICTIWQRNRARGNEADAATAASPIEWRGEGALIVRPYDAVRWVGLGRAGCAFLDACGAGATLADAGAAACAVEPDADLAALGAQLFAAGAFGQMHRARL